MYNVLDFIDCEETRLANKDVEFSPIEQVGIICQSYNHTIQEKMEALLEIASAYENDEDYKPPKVFGRWQRFNKECVCTSIHDTIVETVHIWDNIINGKPVLDCPLVYSVNVFYKGAPYVPNETLLSTFEQALTVLHTAYCNGNVDYAIIKRMYLDTGWAYMDTLYYNSAMELTHIYINNATILNSHLKGSIMEISTRLKTSFKRGDLVKINLNYGAIYGVCQTDTNFNTEYEDIEVGVFDPDMPFKFDYFFVPIYALNRIGVSDLKGDNKILFLIKLMYQGKTDITILSHKCKDVSDMVAVAEELIKEYAYDD